MSIARNRVEVSEVVAMRCADRQFRLTIVALW